MTQAYLTETAFSDLEEIALYIARDNPERATTFTREIVGHCHRIANTPRAGRERPEIRRGIRSVPHGNYVIFYRIVEAGVQILHVLHGARDLSKIPFGP